jgi:hypothetical protein
MITVYVLMIWIPGLYVTNIDNISSNNECVRLGKEITQRIDSPGRRYSCHQVKKHINN